MFVDEPAGNRSGGLESQMDRPFFPAVDQERRSEVVCSIQKKQRVSIARVFMPIMVHEVVIGFFGTYDEALTGWAETSGLPSGPWR